MRDDRPNAGRILVVCTGNVCRSPYIERVLAARLADTGIRVSSAGTGALVGDPMEPQTERRLLQAGADPSGFVARQLTAAMVRAADLVLCATRQHRSLAVRAEPKGLRYTYALADFADLATVVGNHAPEPVEAVGNAVRQLAAVAVLSRDQVRARQPADAEVVDPFRRSDEVFDRMAEQIDDLLPPVVRSLRRLAIVE